SLIECAGRPLYPQKRTSRRVIGMSALCQKRTRALQQKNHYSMTSSASCCRSDGRLRPSALAVLKLITSSNLLGGVGRAPDTKKLVCFGNLYALAASKVLSLLVAKGELQCSAMHSSYLQSAPLAASRSPPSCCGDA